MADSPSPHKFTEHNSNDSDEMLAQSKILERIIEDVENMSVQLTWMAYDLVALRTGPELGASMRRLEEAHRRCRAAVCGNRDQEPEDGRHESAATTLTQLDNIGTRLLSLLMEKHTGNTTTTEFIDLENMLKELDSLSNCMAQMALQIQLRQCDLIICVGCPDKLALLKNPRETKAAAASLT